MAEWLAEKLQATNGPTVSLETSNVISLEINENENINNMKDHLFEKESDDQYVCCLEKLQCSFQITISLFGVILNN